MYLKVTQDEFDDFVKQTVAGKTLPSKHQTYQITEKPIVVDDSKKEERKQDVKTEEISYKNEENI